MYRPISSLNIPESVRLKLQELGFYFCKDIITALECQPSKGLLSLVDAYDIKSQITNIPDIISVVDLWQKECLDFPISIFHKGFDYLLKGGLPVTRITELCGGPGSGKTQLCLQFCVEVQTPSAVGGANGNALYICTDNSFRVDRLMQIAKNSLNHWNNVTSDSTVSHKFNINDLMKGTYVLSVVDCSTLIDYIMNLDDFLKSKPKIKLIIIDSFSFPFVCEFSNTLHRTRTIYKILDKIQQYALKYKLAIVLTNQFTTFVSADESKLMPSLGESFAHRIHHRILLGDGKACLVKSIERFQIATDFIITKEGIR